MNDIQKGISEFYRGDILLLGYRKRPGRDVLWKKIHLSVKAEGGRNEMSVQLIISFLIRKFLKEGDRWPFILCSRPVALRKYI